MLSKLFGIAKIWRAHGIKRNRDSLHVDLMTMVQEDLKKFYLFFHDVYIGRPCLSMSKPIGSPLCQYELGHLKNIAIL
jgi:hypothetical protein